MDSNGSFSVQVRKTWKPKSSWVGMFRQRHGGPVDPEQTQLIGGSPQPAPAAPLAHNPTAPLNPVEDPLMVDWETQGTQSFDHDLAPTIIEQPDGNMEDNFVAFEEPYAEGSNDFFSDEPDEYSDRQSRRSTRSSVPVDERPFARLTAMIRCSAPAGKRRGSRSDGRMRRRSDGRMPNRRSGGRSRAEEKRHRSGTGSAFSVQAVIRALCVIVVIGVTIWFFIVLTRPDKDFLRGQQIVGRVDGMIELMEAHLKTATRAWSTRPVRVLWGCLILLWLVLRAVKKVLIMNNTLVLHWAGLPLIKKFVLRSFLLRCPRLNQSV